MAANTKLDRLIPPIMYVFRSTHRAKDAKRPVLSDPSADGTSAPRARMSQRVAITERALRDEVSRDIESLMNCVAMESTVDLTDFPEVAKSILNYGFPDIAHRSIDELAASDIDGEIVQVIRRFEPRLVASTVRVKRDTSVNSALMKIRYMVDGDLSCEPLNIPVQFIADVEVTTGKFHINRQ